MFWSGLYPGGWAHHFFFILSLEIHLAGFLESESSQVWATLYEKQCVSCNIYTIILWQILFWLWNTFCIKFTTILVLTYIKIIFLFTNKYLFKCLSCTGYFIIPPFFTFLNNTLKMSKYGTLYKNLQICYYIANAYESSWSGWNTQKYNLRITF